MKRTLLLLTALLCIGASGAWAFVSPASGAIPEEGKTYYLYAIQHDGSRSYLYSNEGTLTVSETKQDNDNYKWTVTKSGDNYIIKNEGSGKYLNNYSYLVLFDTSKAYSLTQENSVSDAACVSIYDTDHGRYYVSPKVSVQTTYSTSNYYISDLTKYNAPANYTLNHVFEEVLSEHSLVDGAYYTIYCDNDSKQYLYDNNGALAVGASPTTASQYVWKCTVNGEKYNFYNETTGKYLDWKKVSSSVYNWTIATDDVYHEGCATMYGASAYLVMNVSGAFDNASIHTYPKETNPTYSADFRFDQVNVKRVKFSQPVAVNGLVATSTILVYVDGSDNITLPSDYKYLINGTLYNNTDAASVIVAAGTTNISVGVVLLDYLSDNKLYRLRQQWIQGGTNNYYVYASSTTDNYKLWKTITTPAVTDSYYIWRAGESVDKWNLYNIGKKKYIAKTTTSNTSGSTESFNPMNAASINDAELFVTQASDRTGYVNLASSTTIGAYLNSYGIYDPHTNYVGWYSDPTHYGAYFKLEPVKTVTFSAPITISGTEVSAIYVATDGSDSFTLPTTYKYTINGTTYYAADAAAQIAAAGTEDIEVTVASTLVTSLSQLNNYTRYTVVTASRGGWAVAEGGSQLTRTLAPSLNIAYDVTDAKQQFAFIYYDDTDDDTDNGAYYPYSVSEKKFIAAAGTGNNSVVNLNRLASQSVSFIESGVSGYPVCVEMSNGGDLNVRTGNYEPGVVVYGTSGTYKDDGGNAVAIYEVATFDPTEALNTWKTTDVTYKLYYSGSLVGTKLVEGENLAAAEIPSGLDPLDGLMSYTYSPKTITSGTSEVTVTATWNGPFELSDAPSESSFASGTKWYTVGINAAYESGNYIWTANDDGTLQGVSTSTSASALSEKNLFCFVGNPYTGLTIYKYASTPTQKVEKVADNGTQATVGTTGTLFIPTTSTYRTDANTYACFKVKDSETRLNSYVNATDQGKVYGWTNSGDGSTCWFIPAGKYYLNYLNTLVLDAPVGAVGTKASITSTSNRDLLKEFRNSLAADPFYVPTSVNIATANTVLKTVAESDLIALGEGYWRIVSANTAFVTNQSVTPAIYYDSSEGKLKWKSSALADEPVNDILKLTASGDGYTIYSPNAQKYLKSASTAQSEERGQLGTDAGTMITFSSLGSAQYELKASGDSYAIHANNHDNGVGTSGTLVGWNMNTGNLNSPSAWYIVQAKTYDLPLTAVGDATYATLYLPFDVTISGADAYTLTTTASSAIATPLAENQVPAGVAVLLKGTATTATATINTGSAFTTENENKLEGTYVDVSVTGDSSPIGTTDYFLGVVDDEIGFYHWSGSTLKANRAYLPADNVPAAAKGFVLSWDDLTTGIESIEGNGAGETPALQTYNLAGQRVGQASRLRSGIYIVNGKKVVVK